MNYNNNEKYSLFSWQILNEAKTNSKQVNSIYLKIKIGDSVIQSNYQTFITDIAPFQSLIIISKTRHIHFY